MFHNSLFIRSSIITHTVLRIQERDCSKTPHFHVKCMFIRNENCSIHIVHTLFENNKSPTSMWNVGTFWHYLCGVTNEQTNTHTQHGERMLDVWSIPDTSTCNIVCLLLVLLNTPTPHAIPKQNTCQKNT